MASAIPIWKIQEEATCFICLEYLTEPLTTECGHNFCRACITQYCEQREPESGTKFPCPKCRVPFEKGKFRPNRQLANIIENIKQLKLKPGKVQKENLCETHQEKLKLFCEEDGKSICVVCRESRDHRDHTILPIEEAAQDYKVKLQGALNPLRNELEEGLALTSEEEKKITQWQHKVENRRQSIKREFKKLHQVLSEEEQLLLQRLAEEERKTLERLQDNITKLSEQNATLINLITEVEEKCRQPATELLQDVESALIRSENVKLQQPEAVSPALMNVYKICLDMREMLERFTMDVTLDPGTAHPSLVLSEDRKRVRLGDKCQNLPSNPESFDSCPSVLGTQGFTGGRRYWEVEVGDKTEWALGVCRESGHRPGNVRLNPGNGYWAVWLRGGEYKACTYPSTSFPVRVRPSRVGIFLDYEAGEISFYNVTDRSHLFTFTNTFFGRLRPYFHPGLNAGGKNVAPLIICPVPTGGNLCP
ncbi:E3 ubiquitin-protein ligase TRIM39-like [Emydura macquarii macquarii]|uniref:E3 ubiquitin-protein ligase TRIM39-like n=1 Tax=Emydura macquarii macquarii TaxID=1129001 RepID=UPI00352A4AD9